MNLRTLLSKTLITGFALAICVSSNATQAAEFSILERNPVYFEGLYDSTSIEYLSTYAEGSWNYLSGVCNRNNRRNVEEEDFIPCDNVTDQRGLDTVKRALIEEWSYLFTQGTEPDFEEHSYRSINDLATNISLLTSRVVLISGKIERGDSERFERFIEDNDLLECMGELYCPVNNVIALDSTGGSFSEAIKIAQYVNDHSFVTYLPENSTCVSACSMIFLSGYTEYEGMFFPRRYAHDTARLGLHRPFIQVPERAYSGTEVNNVIRIVNNTLNTAIEVFTNAKLDIAMLGEMYSTPPEEMYYLSVPEMENIGEVFYTPVNRQERVTRAKILSLCANVFKAKYGRYDPALLTSLTSSRNAFLTTVPITDFACYGGQNEEGWYYRICDENECIIRDFVVDEVFQESAALEEYDRTVYGDFDLEPYLNTESAGPDDYGLDSFVGHQMSYVLIGTPLLYAIKTSTRLRLARDLGSAVVQNWRYGKSQNPSAFPAWAARAQVPSMYCGVVDMRANQNMERIQMALNQAGFDAGIADGVVGNQTIRAIEAANTQLLGRASKVVGTDLLLRLGIASAELPSFMLCQ